MKKRTSIHRKYSQGSFTVEAVFVVPVVLFVIFFLLSVQIYMHQKVWFTAAAYEAAMSTDQESVKAERLLAEAPVSLGKPGCSVSVEKHKTEVVYTGEAFSLWVLDGWNYEITAKVERQDPVSHIRNMKSLKEVVKGE